MPSGTCRKNEFLSYAAVNSFKVTRRLHAKQQRNPLVLQYLPQGSAWFGSTNNVHLVHYSFVLLPFHSDAGANEQHNGNKSHAATKCRAGSPAMANTGLSGGFEFIAAALPRHRDNSKQLSDAGVEARNGDTK